MDDIRRAPNGWVQVFNYKEAIRVLSGCDVEEIFLDHDLGGKKTGYDIAVWMVEHDKVPQLVSVHSANPVGREDIEQLLRRYWERMRTRI